MRVAVIGSRGWEIMDLERYMPDDVHLIISGGARGVDTSARQYALKRGIDLLEILPEYQRYGRAAPLKRNITIIKNADFVLAFWDGQSPGTEYTIRECRKRGIPCRVYLKNDPPVK